MLAAGECRFTVVCLFTSKCAEKLLSYSASKGVGVNTRSVAFRETMSVQLLIVFFLAPSLFELLSAFEF